METAITLIKKVQARLGQLDDGKAGRDTFIALGKELDISGTLTKSEILQRVAMRTGYSGDGYSNFENEPEFWASVLAFLDKEDSENNPSDSNDFRVLTIPPKNNKPNDSLFLTLLLIAWEKLKAGYKSKGTFAAGLATIIGSIYAIVGSFSMEAQAASATMSSGIIGIITGIGLMIAREANVSDEKSGAKKLQYVEPPSDSVK